MKIKNTLIRSISALIFTGAVTAGGFLAYRRCQLNCPETSNYGTMTQANTSGTYN